MAGQKDHVHLRGGARRAQGVAGSTRPRRGAPRALSVQRHRRARGHSQEVGFCATIAASWKTGPFFPLGVGPHPGAPHRRTTP